MCLSLDFVGHHAASKLAPFVVFWTHLDARQIFFIFIFGHSQASGFPLFPVFMLSYATLLASYSTTTLTKKHFL